MTKIRQSSKRWGIVVGVDEYINECQHLRNLQGCVADANKMYRTMIDKDYCGFDEDHVRLLENPTYSQIEYAFKDLGSRMKKGDELWFYFAGHGYSERRRKGVSGYLLPSDIGFNDDGTLSTQSCISHDGLRDSFIDRHMGHGNITVVLFFDCCCAASVGLCDGSRAVGVDEKEVSEGFKESFRDLEAIGPTEGGDWDFKYISFMATDKTGKAKEDSSGGVFTKYLIEGLKGGRPECSTVGPNTSDFYIRTGNLGVFLGNYVPNQPPLQDFIDTTYPLSVSKERKARQEQIRQMDKQVIGWLSKLKEEQLLGKDARQFAEDIIYDADVSDFRYAGMLRNLMRLFSVDQNLSGQLNEGAMLINAFSELKSLLEKKEPMGSVGTPNPPSDTKPQIKSAKPLSSNDRELLADVNSRLQEVDGEDVDVLDASYRSQAEAAEALDKLARKRMRQMCGRVRYDPLYSKNERDKWSMNARKGFASAFEAAIYELVRDDKALASRRR